MTEQKERVLIVDDEDLKNTAIGIVILDIKMPGKSGIELLPEIKARYSDTEVVMATATTDINVALQCMKQGAYDYITKPFNLDEVVLSLERALERRRLELDNKEYQQHLEDKVIEQAKKIRASFFSGIMALSHALEAKDKYTSGHSQRVSDISITIAKELGLPHETVNKLRVAGLVHDIGKIGVKESILNKPSRLTDNEYRHIQKHPDIGEHILAPIVDDEEILESVRNHHGRYDGNGYPGHLKGDQIPLGARIMAVADAYEAMTSARPYREAMSANTACIEIERCKGTQFDPTVVGAFFRRSVGS
jgi:putative nucleotidyltransferase with HDIG domain